MPRRHHDVGGEPGAGPIDQTEHQLSDWEILADAINQALGVKGIRRTCAASIPQDALRLPESTLDIRSIQTRNFAAPSEIDILAATIAVLQDMEFNIDRIEKPLGVITASKVSDADVSSEKTRLYILDMMCVLTMVGGCDSRQSAMDEQHITVTIVVLPSLARSGEYATRITIQRVIFDKVARVKVMERIDDAETYQQIFENLSKAKTVKAMIAP